MDRNVLINQLELSYSPLSNYLFNKLKSDPIIQDILESSSLYIIAQRPEISFEKIIHRQEKKTIQFEIHQKNNPEILECEFPYFQENIATNLKKGLAIILEWNNPSQVNDTSSNVHGIRISELDSNPDNPLIWFSPEKFIQNYWKEHIIAKIKGDIREFLKYQVLYIGKATEQGLWKRLTGHNHLQDILSLDNPLVLGAHPTHEITLLFFDFQDTISIRKFGRNSTASDEEIADALIGKDIPNRKTIFLDVEKALIKAMQPIHNKTKFKQYPVSDDGLHKHNLDAYSYTFMDPITLKYSLGEEIRGGLDNWGGDRIIVTGNNDMKLIRHRLTPCRE